MRESWRTVRVFISSTFKDMQAERDHLVRFVFPRMREELFRRHIYLVDVDLRWGVTSEQNAYDVCMEEIDNCHPRFICLLGGRYGWIPPKSDISITASEINYGALDKLEEPVFRYFYFRDPNVTASIPKDFAKDFREPSGSESEKLLESLKDHIMDHETKGKILIEPGKSERKSLPFYIYPCKWDNKLNRIVNLESFGNIVYNDLMNSIDAELGEEKTEVLNEFDEEKAAMDTFINEKIENYVVGSRRQILDSMYKFVIDDENTSFLCLHGKPGSGKTALMARFYHEYTKNQDMSKEVVIPLFVGATVRSTDLRKILRRFCYELLKITNNPEEVPEDYENLIKKFNSLLKEASLIKPILFLIDAFNQIDRGDNNWFPDEIPKNVHFFISTLSGPELESLKKLRIPPEEITLTPLKSSDSKLIINKFLSKYRKKFDNYQIKALIHKKDSNNPLYLKTALEELRTLGTYEEITDCIINLPETVQPLFQWILKRLENDQGFIGKKGSLIGSEIVPEFTSLIAVSRHGLSLKELTELIDPDDPRGNIAALQRLLRPYLMYKDELIYFYHGQLKEAVDNRYLDYKNKLDYNRKLADYFHKKADPHDNLSWNGKNPRSFSELPHHQIEAELWGDIEDTLTDLEFIDIKCNHGMIFGLIEDLNESIAIKNLPSLLQMSKALKFNTPTILDRPNLTKQTLYNFLYWAEEVEPKIRTKLKKAHKKLDEQMYWIKTEAPLPKSETSSNIYINFINPSEIQSLSSEHNCIAISSPQGETEVYSLQSGEVIYKEKFDKGIVKGILMGIDHKLIYTTKKGRIFYNMREIPILTRENEEILPKKFKNGIIIATDHNSLTYYDLDKQESEIIDIQVPFPLISLEISPNNKKIIYIAGLDDQKIVQLQKINGYWEKEIIPYQGAPVVDTDLNEHHLLLITKDRYLRLIDLNNCNTFAKIYYQTKIRGMPLKCSLDTESRAFFFTNQGIIASWNWQSNSLNKLQDLKQPVIIFNYIPRFKNLFISTTEISRTIENSLKTSKFHSAEITECIINDNNHVVSFSKLDKSIQWFSFTGLNSIKRQYCEGITSITKYGKKDNIIMGDEHGNVWIGLESHESEDVNHNNINKLNEPVVSLINQDKEIIAAGQFGGVVKIPLSNGEVEWKPSKHQFIKKIKGEFQNQIKLLKIGGDFFLSFYISADYSFLSLIINKSEKIIYKTKKSINDVQINPKDNILCLAGQSVQILKIHLLRNRNLPNLLYKKSTPVKKCVFLNEGDYIGVIIQNSPYLEIWEVKKDLPTVASIRLPGSVSSINSHENKIVMGFGSGELMTVSFKIKKGVD
ncbi:MAG: NACHT domain protein [Methanobacterium sp. PtaB.Bin024]|jgi:telomerase protein component 1|nr:MAG: NACHT domain protein [Methanobacterium sp. PtaB.Bin024]